MSWIAAIFLFAVIFGVIYALRQKGSDW